MRHRDIHLLTVGRYTYTSDQRFRAINNPQSSENWTLMVKYPQLRDSGIYECQISTTPHISYYVHLNVVGESRYFVKKKIILILIICFCFRLIMIKIFISNNQKVNSILVIFKFFSFSCLIISLFMLSAL